MRKLVLIVSILAWALNAQAQDLEFFGGAWINADFIQELKSQRSVPLAMKAKGETDPLWVEIDPANDSTITLSRSFGEPVKLKLWQENLFGTTLNWVVGKGLDIEYVVTIDTLSQTYIALYQYHNQEAPPIVLGKLPAKRQEADFLLERMINASMFTGRWTDASGGYYEFKNNMSGTWDGIPVRLRLDVEPETNTVLVSVQREGESSTLYRAETVGGKLSLTLGTTHPLVLTRLRN